MNFCSPRARWEVSSDEIPQFLAKTIEGRSNALNRIFIQHIFYICQEVVYYVNIIYDRFPTKSNLRTYAAMIAPNFQQFWHISDVIFCRISFELVYEVFRGSNLKLTAFLQPFTMNNTDNRIYGVNFGFQLFEGEVFLFDRN